jgi:enoyl-CoA hydratase
MAGYKKINYEKTDAAVVITINNPPVNALSSEVLDELDSALNDFAASADARVAIIRSALEDIFIAGADIHELKSTSAREIGSYIKKGQALFNKIEMLPKIVIAAVNGACVGGGNELALSCDIRIASENAHFGQPEIKLGLMPGWGGIERLVRLAGRGLAQVMLLTGNPINAQKGLETGFISKIVKRDELISSVKRLADELGQNAPLAVESTKEALYRCTGVPKTEAHRVEALLFERLFNTKDAHEGIDAFFNRCTPSFTGQ